MRRTGFYSGLTAALAAVLLAGCFAGTPNLGPSQQPVEAGHACEDLADTGNQIEFGDELGDEIHGVELGMGKTGVILAHEESGDVCEWLPFGQELQANGYHVLVFDFVDDSVGVSKGPEGDMVRQLQSAAAFLRKLGAQSIVLMGASMGATGVLNAGGVLSPGPAAVVALSPIGDYKGVKAVDGAKKVTVPLLVAAGKKDTITYPDSADIAQAAYAQAPAKNKKLLLGNDELRGHNIVTQGIGHDDVRVQVLTWLTTVAPPLP
ncbi:alpha/beta hydrolase [Hamadaea tsunoensis]|uniref:alpha/beta hydrolase n=1 Tax=Hamadaea tsunoensis TaxID=53368 RepID=UPI0012FB3147|nr:alpha/beta hydrolase [Hamadaea tsunoensis]